MPITWSSSKIQAWNFHHTLCYVRAGNCANLRPITCLCQTLCVVVVSILDVCGRPLIANPVTYQSLPNKLNYQALSLYGNLFDIWSSSNIASGHDCSSDFKFMHIILLEVMILLLFCSSINSNNCLSLVALNLAFSGFMVQNQFSWCLISSGTYEKWNYSLEGSWKGLQQIFATFFGCHYRGLN